MNTVELTSEDYSEIVGWLDLYLEACQEHYEEQLKGDNAATAHETLMTLRERAIKVFKKLGG